MSPAFEPGGPGYEHRVRENFARQGLMATLAAELRSIKPGAVEIEVPFSPGLSQQDDFFHAGVGIAILDSACGCAAFTLMAPGTRVLTVELKVNLLAPAVCPGDAYAVSGGGSKHVATILATMTAIAEAN
jgi:acyl-coenzyme A thioesterase PaaI-like protein